MTYREYIKMVGYETFAIRTGGWCDVEWIMNHLLDYPVDRYTIRSHEPLHEALKDYKDDCEANKDDSWSFYDWLGDQPTEDEITAFTITYKKEEN